MIIEILYDMRQSDPLTCRRFFLQRLSIQEVPPLLNGESSNRSQQQRGGSSVSSDTTPRSASTQNSTAHNTGASSSPAQPQTTSVQLESISSLLSPPSGSAFLSLSPASASSLHSLQGLAPPLNAPRTPPMPHSAPLSRALTPIPPSALSPPPHNLLPPRAADVYTTSTLPLPRKQANESRTGFMGNSSGLCGILEHNTCSSAHCTADSFFLIVII